MCAPFVFSVVIFFAWSQACFAAMPPRPPPPPPPPPPGRPPTPPQPSPEMQPPGPLGPQTLEPYECSVGAARTGLANITFYAMLGVLYVDTGRPAECSGEIVRWEVCYRYESNVRSGPNVTFLVIREDDSILRVSARYQVVLSGLAEQSTSCDYIEAMEPVFVQTGDLIGFYTDSVLVAFASYATPSLSQYTPLIQSSAGGILGIRTLQQDQLVPIDRVVAPVIRLIMNSTDDNSTAMPSPSPTSTSRTPCPTKKGKGGGSVSVPVFASVVAVAVAIIAVLFVMVCILFCCLCGLPCIKCCKLFQCCCQRRKKEQVTVKVNSQVSQPITEQSMQYNDMYIPKDPTEIITKGKKQKTSLFGNPAYDTPTSKAVRDAHSPAGYDIPVSKGQRYDLDTMTVKKNVADLTSSEADGEMEHTYETISGMH